MNEGLFEVVNEGLFEDVCVRSRNDFHRVL